MLCVTFERHLLLQRRSALSPRSAVAHQNEGVMEEFFVHNHLRARSLQRPDLDAANAELGALLLRYLHDGFNDDYGAWIEAGRDERVALRSTCFAAEALHKL